MKLFKILLTAVAVLGITTGIATAKDIIKLEGAFYIVGTNVIDVTEGAKKAAYTEQGAVVVPTRKSVNDDSIYVSNASFIAVFKYKDKYISYHSGYSLLKIKVTPYDIENMYKDGALRDPLKVNGQEILSAYYGVTGALQERISVLPEYIKDGILEVSASGAIYDYKIGGPRNLIVLYRKSAKAPLKAAVTPEGKDTVFKLP